MARTIRLVTLGDSITSTQTTNPNPCGTSWPGHLTTLASSLIHNAGVGGEATGPMFNRLSSDVLAYNPTDVTIMGGTNDVINQQSLASSMVNVGNIIDGVREAGAIPWVLTIPPMSPSYAPWANPTSVMAYNTALRELALERGARLIDTWAAVADSSGDWAIASYTCDDVHPNNAAGLLLAAAVEAALLAPLISSTPDVIGAWVTGLDGTFLAALDRSTASPFRRFAFSREIGGPGVGSLEYHLDNDLVRAHDDLFAFGNLVWMRYRGRTVAWIVEERHTSLDEGEHESDWVKVAGRGTRQLLGDRIVWPTEFSEATTDPLLWGLGGWKTKTDASAAVGQPVVPVVSTTTGSGAAVGIPVRITGGGQSQLGIIASIVAGVSITLEDDLAFTFPVGSRVVGATEQWRRFVNRASGEMIWDLVSESNPRFATQLVRGVIQSTGADGWTQDLRFDNLLDDVVKDVEAKFGDVEVAGLTVHYHNVLGIDRTESVILEEGADLVKLAFEENDRDSLSWVVTEGTGEAVYAKLQPKEKPTRTTRKTPAKKTPVRRKAPEAPAKVEYQRVEYPVFYTEEAEPVVRRREAYVDDKGHATEVELDDTGRAVLEDHAIRDGVGFEAVETRYQAETHYSLGDWIRFIAPSRGVDEDARIVALVYVEDDDEVVRVGAEVNTAREEYLLRLKSKADRTASSVGVRNRQPQGNTILVPISAAVYLDTTTDSVTSFRIPDRVAPIIEAPLAIDFDQYPMPVSAAATSGSLTSDSGGGATTVSGGSATSGSGGSSSPTSSSAASHRHRVLFHLSSGATYALSDDYSMRNAGAGAITVSVASSSPQDLYTYDADGAHDHTVTIGSHTHTTPAHTHDTPDHQHSVPGHGHSLTAAATKEAYPVSHSVTVKLYELVDTTWTLRYTSPAITADREELDLLPYIYAGQWRITLQSAGGQPNGGRIGAHLSGYVFGSTQSA